MIYCSSTECSEVDSKYLIFFYDHGFRKMDVHNSNQFPQDQEPLVAILVVSAVLALNSIGYLPSKNTKLVYKFDSYIAWDPALTSKNFSYSHHILKFNIFTNRILSVLKRNIVESLLWLIFYFFYFCHRVYYQVSCNSRILLNLF